MKVVSLIASSTEMICALGCESMLVGRSHECDYPESVKDLPLCSEPKFETEGTSREIDERVKAMAKESGSLYRVDEELLKKLEPDVIVTQDHCKVCAIALDDVQRAVCVLFDSPPQIVALLPNGIDDVWEGLRRIAEALRVPEKGEALIASLRGRLDDLASRARALKRRPSVGCIEWIDPLMAGGNWVPELVELLGARNCFGKAREHSPWMGWEDLKREDPEILVIMACGWDIERSLREMKALTSRPEWQKLQAVRSGRVYVTDGNQYFNRPGPRLVDSVEILAEIFYPETFDFGYKDRGWKKF